MPPLHGTRVTCSVPLKFPLHPPLHTPTTLQAVLDVLAAKGDGQGRTSAATDLAQREAELEGRRRQARSRDQRQGHDWVLNWQLG